MRGGLKRCSKSWLNRWSWRWCPFALALISHNVLPKSFAPALALYVAIQATLMARAMFEGKKLCEIRARGQKGKNKDKTTN